MNLRTALIAAAFVLLGPQSASAATLTDAFWSGGGTATTTVVAGGTSGGAAEFAYSSKTSGAWTFRATAKTAHRETLDWSYTGHHAWYQVTVGIQRFVLRNGVETVETLAGAGPVDCCATPSAGFSYSGRTSFDPACSPRGATAWRSASRSSRAQPRPR